MPDQVKTDFPLPFQSMALSLSGGGYRATAYHLGAMSYLHSKKFGESTLLQNVDALSTISGGTITGAMYVLKLSQNKSFDICFDTIYNLLEDDNLVVNALEKLKWPNSWGNTHKSRDVINAFAEVYNEKFYNRVTFKDLDNKTGHLKDVIFGSSDFTTGLQFRLIENKGQARFGNGKIMLSKEVAPFVRLADAVASSSCFPGGFEPMIMPKDFGNGPKSVVDKYWNEKEDGLLKKVDKNGNEKDNSSKTEEDDNLNEKGNASDETTVINERVITEFLDIDLSDKVNEKKRSLYQPTAIMDGGIIDNQGIEAIKLADERNARNRGKEGEDRMPFGTFIISDVASKEIYPYEVPVLEHNKMLDWVSLNVINTVAIILSALCIYVITYSCYIELRLAAASLITVLVIWFIIYIAVRNKVVNAVKSAFGKIHSPKVLHNFNFVRSIPIYILAYLVKFRITSVVKMVMEVFLNRIRSLQITSLYEDPKWRYRVQTNYIYDLMKDPKEYNMQGNKKGKEEDTPIDKVVKKANSMPTTLWFGESDKEEDDKMLDALIACGQLNLCHNLIEYIKSIRKLNAPLQPENNDPAKSLWNMIPKKYIEQIELLEKSLKEDWSEFEKNPKWLLSINKKSK